MTEFPAVLIALACPIGMAAMMIVLVLGRRFHRRSPIAADSWAALSPSASVVTVEDTCHHIELDQPALVIDQVLNLLP